MLNSVLTTRVNVQQCTYYKTKCSTVYLLQEWMFNSVLTTRLNAQQCTYYKSECCTTRMNAVRCTTRVNAVRCTTRMNTLLQKWMLHYKNECCTVHYKNEYFTTRVNAVRCTTRMNTVLQEWMLYGVLQEWILYYKSECCTVYYKNECSAVLYTNECCTVYYKNEYRTVYYKNECCAVYYKNDCCHRRGSPTAPACIQYWQCPTDIPPLSTTVCHWMSLAPTENSLTHNWMCMWNRNHLPLNTAYKSTHNSVFRDAAHGEVTTPHPHPNREHTLQHFPTSSHILF